MAESDDTKTREAVERVRKIRKLSRVIAPVPVEDVDTLLSALDRLTRERDAARVAR